MEDGAESQTGICPVCFLCASAAIRVSFSVISKLLFLWFTAASLCVWQLPPSCRTRQTRGNVMNGCSQRRGNGISDPNNKTDQKRIDLLVPIDGWIESLSDGWVAVGRLSDLPITLSLLQLFSYNINLVGPPANGAAGTDVERLLFALGDL